MGQAYQERDHQISIHALREEGDGSSQVNRSASPHFYPRPPRGGRPHTHPSPSNIMRISIHALREEGDGDLIATDTPQKKFLSTPSARRATHVRDAQTGAHTFLSTPSARRATMPHRPAAAGGLISIHALREEGDAVMEQQVPTSWISIHALREEGDYRTVESWCAGHRFLSTPSARRATLLL